jgi:hypothetical protein
MKIKNAAGSGTNLCRVDAGWFVLNSVTFAMTRLLLPPPWIGAKAFWSVGQPRQDKTSRSNQSRSQLTKHAGDG